MKTLRCLPVALSLICGPLFADQNIAGNVTITGGAATGNLTVTGTIDSEGNVVTFGTQGTAFGAALLYQDNAIDTFTFNANRNPASWLWQHSAAIAAMRLDASHQLILYQADGTTAGVTLAPASNSIKLGAHANGTLTADANGVITSGGGFAVLGGITNASGTLTGGASGLALNAGGTNQSITLNSSGGDLIFSTSSTERMRIMAGGNVGIGTMNPTQKLQVQKSGTAPAFMIGGGFAGSPRIQTYGLDADGNAWMGLGADMGGGPYEHSLYFPSAGPGKLTIGDFNGTTYNTRMTVSASGNVGIGTSNPATKLDVAGAVTFSEHLYKSVSSLGGVDPALITAQSEWSAGEVPIITLGFEQGYAGGTDMDTKIWSYARTPQESRSFVAVGRGRIDLASPAVAIQGNVGIGKTAPRARLDIANATALPADFIGLWDSGAIVQYGIGIDIAPVQSGMVFYSGDRGFTFKTQSLTAVGTQLMTITNGGNVGIGTTAPGAKLTAAASSGSNPTTASFGAGYTIAGNYQRAVGYNAPVLVTGVTNANNDGYAGLLMLGSSYTTEATGQTVGGVEFLQPTSGKSDFNAGSKAAIYGVTAGGGGTTGGYGGQLQFATRPDNSATSPWSAIRMTIDQSGNVGIGTLNPAHKLAVKGTIRAEEVIVDTGWADYVFEEDYRLAPLAEVEEHIKAKKHLPGIPSASEVAAHGVSMGDMQAKLLSKVEELTLHLIAQEKELAALRSEVAQLKASSHR